MKDKFSQWVAIKTIALSSFKAMMRSPSALAFSIAFPLIFILLFGFMGGGPSTATIAFSQKSDTLNQFYGFFNKLQNIRVAVSRNDSVNLEALKRGSLSAILNIELNKDTTKSKYNVHIVSSNASVDKIGLINASIQALQFNLDKNNFKDNKTYTTTSSETISGRPFKTIDFILPGQLGFSLLSTGLFGVAFLLFNLKETLVIKRYFATPVRKSSILFGEGLARVLFQLIVSSFILLLGKFLFGYTLVNGWLTFIELLALCLVGVFLFMGFGFLISAFSKTINTIPVYTNLLGFPQLLLSGTFFPIDAFPGWLKPIAKIMPLTHLNDCMRKIGFSGYHLTDCGMQLGVIAIWIVILYALAIRIFKWE
jgi:ABC-2 type transport system permease protein